MKNVVDQTDYADAKKKLRAELERWMKETKDPRASGGGDEIDRYPYFGDARSMPANAKPDAK